MKCESCEKKIKRKEAIKVNVINSDGKKITSFHVCKDCGVLYKVLQDLIDEHGEEVVFEMLKEVMEKVE